MIIGTLAQNLGAVALYPFGGPPYWPFQQWAQRCEPVHPSPLGLLTRATASGTLIGGRLGSRNRSTFRRPRRRRARAKPAPRSRASAPARSARLSSAATMFRPAWAIGEAGRLPTAWIIPVWPAAPARSGPNTRTSPPSRLLRCGRFCWGAGNRSYRKTEPHRVAPGPRPN